MNRPRTALVLSSLLLAAACGGGDSDDDSSKEAEKPSASEAVDLVHESVDTTLAVKSMDIESEANLEVQAQKMSFGVDGAMDYENLIGDVTLNTQQSGQDQQIQIVTDGDKVWFRIDGNEAAAIPGGKTWAEGDVQTLRASESVEPIGLAGVVIALRGAEEVEVGDSKEIDGVPARQFKTTVVYADAVEAAGDDRDAFAKSFSLTGVDDADLDIEVWIGDDGVIRDFNLDVDAHDKPVDGTYELEISDANAEVDTPEAPAADDVLTGPEADAWISQMMAG
ncbi:hypothetical protein ASG90_00325 [Nocardioides sp. Soil797]|nr:hypothetical protein ASG90_00325 [Nocardioides sp. Soil797]